ncbi:MAG: hopanoid-associated phosphorylase [Rhizomicrobium sp.]
MIIAVTGLAREARLIAGPDILPVVGGGDAVSLERRLSAELEKGARRILSIGICGALSPELRVGDAIVASEVVSAEESFPTHGRWSRELATRVPGAILAPLAGTDSMAADRNGKARLRAITRASAVDMESHVAARAARLQGLPFAALRIVSDGAHRTLPPAARVAMRTSGGIDIGAVLRSLLRAPLQFPALIRTAWEAEIAFAVLFRCRHMLDAGFARADLGELALNVG